MRRIGILLLGIFMIGGWSESARGQGVLFPGGGPASRMMGGASTATALDAASALFWNPATMGTLPQSQVVIGGELAIGDINLSSNLPLLGQSGRTRSDGGVGLLNAVGIVYRDPESPLTYGLGLSTVGGGSVNFPGGTDNPIVAPTGPFGQTVLGPIGATALFNQITPSVAYQASDRLIVGAGPTIGINVVSFDPAYFAGTNDANGDGLNTFPNGSHSRPFWGGGFRAGLLYQLTDTLDIGFGYTSPQWNETWKFNSRDEVGNALPLRLNVTLPAIYSWGVSYRGIENLVLSTDLRYIDYANTDLFGQRLIDGGLAWQSVFGLGTGAQYRLSESLAVRAGYQYNENPIRDPLTLFNMQLPGITQHSVSVGMEYRLNEWISSTLGYVHAFENSITGPVSQFGQGTVTLSAEADYIVFGVLINFGPKAEPNCSACDCSYPDEMTYTSPMPDSGNEVGWNERSMEPLPPGQ